MDVLNIRGGDRNGLNGQFFNFVPLAPVGGVVAVGVAKGREKRKKKYANAETQRLADAYPEQDNATDQAVVVQQLLSESAAVLEQRNKSKGKKRAELTGKLRAYDEYIRDMQSRLKGLQAAQPETPRIEPIMPSEAKEVVQEPTKTAPEDVVLSTASVNNQGTTKQAVTPSTTELQGMVEGSTPAPKKMNTMLWVGLGLALILVIALKEK